MTVTTGTMEANRTPRGEKERTGDATRVAAAVTVTTAEIGDLERPRLRAWPMGCGTAVADCTADEINRPVTTSCSGADTMRHRTRGAKNTGSPCPSKAGAEECRWKSGWLPIACSGTGAKSSRVVTAWLGETSAIIGSRAVPLRELEMLEAKPEPAASVDRTGSTGAEYSVRSRAGTGVATGAPAGRPCALQEAVSTRAEGGAGAAVAVGWTTSRGEACRLTMRKRLDSTVTAVGKAAGTLDVTLRMDP